MTRITIELVDDPVPEKRHRVKMQQTKSGRSWPQMYRDPRSVTYAAKVRVAAQIAWKAQTGGAPPTHLWCRLEVDIFVRCAQSPQISEGQAREFGLAVKSGKKIRELMLAGVIRPKGADVDNHLKTIMDACNRNVWDDDSGVAQATVRKWYAETGRTVFTVEMIDPPVLPVAEPEPRRPRRGPRGLAIPAPELLL